MSEITDRYKEIASEFLESRDSYRAVEDNFSISYLDEDDITYLSQSYEEAEQEDFEKFLDEVPDVIIHMVGVVEKALNKIPIPEKPAKNVYKDSRDRLMSKNVLHGVDQEQFYEDVIAMRNSSNQVSDAFNQCWSSYRDLKKLESDASEESRRTMLKSSLATEEEKFRQELSKILDSSLEHSTAPAVLTGKDPFQTIVENSPPESENFLELYIKENKEKVMNWLDNRPDVEDEDIDELMS